MYLSTQPLGEPGTQGKESPAFANTMMVPAVPPLRRGLRLPRLRSLRPPLPALLLLLPLLVLALALVQLPRRAAAIGFTTDAIDLANAGREPEALRMFRKHARAFPDDGPGWNNLGVATMRAALRDAAAQDAAARDMLLEAAQHFRRSLALSYRTGTADNYRSVRMQLSALFHQEIPALADDPLAASHPDEFCDEPAAVSAAAAAAASGEGSSSNDGDSSCGWDPMELPAAEVRRRIDATCGGGGSGGGGAHATTGSALRLRVTQAERKSGLLDLHTLLAARAAVRTCGLVVLERLFSKATVTKLRAAQEEHFAEFKARVDTDSEGSTNTTASAQRSPMRYEVKFDSMKHPAFAAPALVRNPLLYSFVKSFLKTGDLEVDTHSSVTSLPGAPDQHWHQDTGALFDEDTWARRRQHPPPHGLVMFIALEDVGVANGPTEFLVGSHLSCDASAQVEVKIEKMYFQMCPFVAAPLRVQATMPAGSVAVFDLRILHRGLGNRGKKNRHLLYMSYVRDWYFDRVNFKDPHTARFDGWDAPRQKLLRRVDATDYIVRLEHRLRELGEDVDALKGGSTDLLLTA